MTGERIPQGRRLLRLEAPTDPTAAHVGPRGMDRGRRIGIVLCALMYRLQVRSFDVSPEQGPVIFVANHSNFMDGPVLFGSLPRRVSFLIKAEAVTGPLGWLLKNVGQYAIDRDTPNREPLLAALAQLKRGGAIGLFPEGTRGAGNVENVFNGAGWLAARSGATVVPVAVRGTARPAGSSRRFRPDVFVLAGEPFPVPLGAGKKAVQAATDLIRENLAAQVVRLDSQLRRVRGVQSKTGKWATQ